MKRNWFARHPIGFMALYFLLYLSAFNFLETQISMPRVLLVHCPTLHGSHGSLSPCSTCCGRPRARTSGGCACRCSAV